MSNYTQRGFVACRKLGGGEAVLKTFPVSASPNEAYFIGDAVTLGASGKVRPLKSASTTAPLGVINALWESVGGKPMPRRLSMPSSGPYLTSGTAGFATVNIDAEQTYIVQIDKNITDADFGAVAKVSAGAPSTGTGLSGQTLTGTVTTSTDSQFQLLGFAPVEMVGTRTSAASPVLVEVKMARSVFGGNPV